jgi:hypothetical protein
VNALWIIGALFLASVAGVVLMFVLAECWGWLMMRDPREFYRRQTQEQEQAELDAIYNHASHYNRLTESALPHIKGDYTDYQPFMLDAEPGSWVDGRPAA